MIPSRDKILKLLPPDKNKWVTVVEDQKTQDIIEGMLYFQDKFSSHYDRIGTVYCGRTIDETADNLFAFCKRNITYRAEGADWQSTAVPSGVLLRGYGDCKAYASFIGGCLGAINRAGVQSIPWQYCFASYRPWEFVNMYHVFIICENEKGEKIWIDPTPGANNMTPWWWVKIPM